MIDEECLKTTCGAPYQTCLDYSRCARLTTCLKDCMSHFDSDTSPMKWVTHSCVNKCAYNYEDIYFVALARCLTDNKCVHLPTYPSTCRYPNKTRQYQKYQLSDLKGGWWVAKGYNRAYDCLVCQHTFFDAVPFMKNDYIYRPTFYTSGANDTLKLVNGSVLVDLDEINPGDTIELDYYMFGVPFKLSWHVLDGYPDGTIVFVYYCGSLLNWKYEGAMILSRSKELPNGSDQALKEQVSVTTGLDYNKFCTNSNTDCANT